MSYFSQSAKKSSIEPNLLTPSPFKYNPKNIHKPVCAQVPFGSTSRLQRSLSNSIIQDKNHFNGPHVEPYQQYENAINQLAGYEKHDKSSSAFVSKTQRFQKTKQQLPGPGQYNLRTQRQLTKSMNKLAKMNKKVHHSLSTSQIKSPSIPSDYLGFRQDQNNNMKKVIPPHQIHPHPGSYDIQGNLNQSKGIKWKQDAKQSTKSTLETPGPGAYEIKGQNKQLKAPVSAFVSDSKRFADKNGQKPGPGSYNVSVMNKKSHSFNLQGNFNSKTSRFSFINKDQKLGPGKYFNSVKERVKAKSVSTLRPKLHNKQIPQPIAPKKTIFDVKNANPGPGQYANTQGITFKLQKELFRKFNDTTLPKQKRALFEISESAITPGPGCYPNKKPDQQAKEKKPNPYKKEPRRTEVVNLKDPEEQKTPSPFEYGNFNNTIENKLNHYQNRMTLTQAIPFGSGTKRFKHYEAGKHSMANDNIYHLEEDQATSTGGQASNELGYYQNTKKVKKIVMTNLKVKVPFGSSASKMPLEMASETPDKFYAKETDWLKKSHNIRSKLN